MWHTSTLLFKELYFLRRGNVAATCLSPSLSQLREPQIQQVFGNLQSSGGTSNNVGKNKTRTRKLNHSSSSIQSEFILTRSSENVADRNWAHRFITRGLGGSLWTSPNKWRQTLNARLNWRFIQPTSRPNKNKSKNIIVTRKILKLYYFGCRDSCAPRIPNENGV
jgi:hypothetical protein